MIATRGICDKFGGGDPSISIASVVKHLEKAMASWLHMLPWLSLCKDRSVTGFARLEAMIDLVQISRPVTFPGLSSVDTSS